MNKIVTFFHNVVISLSLIILLIFLWFSLFSTSCVDLMERVYYTGINGLKALMISVCITIIFSLPFVNKKIKSMDKYLTDNPKVFGRIFYSLLAVLTLICIWWVFSTRFLARFDSQSVLYAAINLTEGVYDDFSPGGYIDMYGNQIGITLLMAALMKITGITGELLFQTINAICVPLIYLGLSEFISSRFYKICLVVFGIVWYPLIISASHVYGNVPGFLFALWAFVLLFRYFKKGKPAYALISIFFIALACLIKQNYFIFLIAYVLLSLYESMRQKKKYVLWGILAIVASIAAIKTATVVTEQIIVTRMTGGVSAWSFIAMGMQEGERGPGWFNGYNAEVYALSNYDPELQKQLALASIKERTSEFASHPAYFIDFYTKKLDSQWNNPTIQSLWILRGYEGTLPKFVEYMVSVRGTLDQLNYLKPFHVFILLFSVVFLFFGTGKDDARNLIFLVFLGGVFFHLMWEAKAQYSLPYVCLLIPAALCGFDRLTSFLAGLLSRKKENALQESAKVIARRGIVCALIFMLLIAGLYVKKVPTGLTSDTYAYFQWIVDCIDE